MKKIKQAIESYCKVIIPELNNGVIVTELSENNWEVIVMVNKTVYQYLNYIRNGKGLKRRELKFMYELKDMFYGHDFLVKIELDRKD